MKNYVSHLECAYSGEIFERDKIHTISNIGKPLIVKYDLESIAKEVSRTSIEESMDPGFWRYAPLLPIRSKKNMVSLGEVVTPLIPINENGQIFGSEAGSIIVKDESRLPTGSFKA